MFRPAMPVTVTMPRAMARSRASAGQHREYIEEQLGHFASNARANETMHENAKNLTSEEAKAVAAYVAAQ